MGCEGFTILSGHADSKGAHAKCALDIDAGNKHLVDIPVTKCLCELRFASRVHVIC